MRKYIKSQILGLMSSIKEAQGMLHILLEERKMEQMISLLTEIQEVAIHIGNEIEQSEGEGIKAVKRLEEYCELVWQCANCQELEENRTKLMELKKKLCQVEQEIENGIREQKEIVFLPYKASMWDSLESIYLAAKEDPDCICKVIPIPYFDKEKDGTLGAMHYEGNEFPENVEITDYTAYSIENRRPDIIYFHYPYDQFNFVTTVHPAFYSSELKKHTDMLVYVPYFVVENDVPEHFCEAIGVYHADRVIVQSEKVKKTYQKVLMRNLLNTDNDTPAYRKAVKSIVEEKVLALGSPKTDKVLLVSKDGQEIPESWKKYIFREDGTKRKVVFYNTTIESLLRYKENMIEKIKQVIDQFREREEFVLLWRPHPLYRTTIQSMRSELVEEYEQLVTEFKESGYGIYDDGPDMYPALAVSDAYYGDFSSLIPLYRTLEKPIMIQNARQKDVPEELLPASILMEEENVWFTALEFNGLFCWNRSTDETEFIGTIPGEALYRRLLYRTMVRVDNLIVMVPLVAEELAVYDLETGEFQKYKLPESSVESRWKFTSASVYGSSVYLIPGTYGCIVKFDAVKRQVIKVTTFDQWFDRDETDTSVLSLAKRDGVTYKQFLYIPLRKENRIAVLNMQTGCMEKEMIKLREPQMGITVVKDDLIIFLGDSKKLMKLNLLTGKGEEITLNGMECLEGVSEIERIITEEEMIYVFAEGNKEIWRIDLNNGVAIRLSELLEKNVLCDKEVLVHVAEKREQKLIFAIEENAINQNGHIYELDQSSEKIQEINLPYPKEWDKMFEQHYVGQVQEEYLEEKGCMNAVSQGAYLQVLFGVIGKTKHCKSTGNSQLAGPAIHKTIMGEKSRRC